MHERNAVVMLSVVLPTGSCRLPTAIDGKHDWGCFPSVREVMQAYGYSREQIWSLVQAGAYEAYRHAAGLRWEWRLQQIRPPRAESSSDIG